MLSVTVRSNRLMSCDFISSRTVDLCLRSSRVPLFLLLLGVFVVRGLGDGHHLFGRSFSGAEEAID